MNVPTATTLTGAAQTARIATPTLAASTAATAFDVLEQEARALMTRLDQVRPFAVRETMVPAAALPPALLSAIDNYLIGGRRQVRQMLQRFINWLRSPVGRSGSPEAAHRRFTMLRLRFNVTLSQFDIFADALTQRSEHETGIWLAGLDVVAADALNLSDNFYETAGPTPNQLPGLICYLDRGHGAAIRRARTRLPGGGENPVALIRVPRERMVGCGIASSLVHEVGHQAAALLDLVESIRPVLRGLQRNGGAEGAAWQYWDRCISEIVADFWAVARVGITASIGLMAVVTLPRYFVFRLNLDDPHPVPWIRMRLSCALGRALYPHPQWDQLEQIWLAYYPPEQVDQEKRRTLDLLAGTMPGLASLLAHHRPKALRGASLREVLSTDERQPAKLLALFQAWRAAPQQRFQAAPTLVFAVIGQALASGLISPEQVSRVLTRMLNHWALRDALDHKTNCAKPASLRAAATSFSFVTN